VKGDEGPPVSPAPLSSVRNGAPLIRALLYLIGHRGATTPQRQATLTKTSGGVCALQTLRISPAASFSSFIDWVNQDAHLSSGKIPKFDEYLMYKGKYGDMIGYKDPTTWNLRLRSCTKMQDS